jgi:cytochrome oxidase Cu insertion factor (SCO1/SenC/PrrC family)
MNRFLLLLIAVLLGFTSWSLWMTSEKTSQTSQLDQAEERKEAEVGADFTLTNQQGQLVHATDYRGRIMLVFFGFTRCPDICPVTVANMSKAMELLGSQADSVAPVFISVDPEHDTPVVMKDFVSNFDKHMIGLTGSMEQIKQVTEAYKVYFAKASLPAGNGYAVDHSAFIYMMGKDGKFRRLFQNNADAAEIARAVKHALE